jgi:hypothetical protein
MFDTSEGRGAYSGAFYTGLDDGSRRSAEAIVPMLLELFMPRSVVDVGSGGGHWAAVCLASGIEDVLAIDGDWAPARAAQTGRFLEHDLSRRLVLGRTFDLAMCLETAEHLPASAAPDLVQALTDAAPVVVFSAALPGQGGDGHINEQLASYWANLFAGRDYACFTDLRRRIWNDETLEVWYRQNLLCFVRRSELAGFVGGLTAPIEPDDPLLDIAHPAFLERHKARADGLEAYAHRLEAELAQSQAELKGSRAELERIRHSRAWRALRLAARPIRLLRRYAIGPRELSSAP